MYESLFDDDVIKRGEIYVDLCASAEEKKVVCIICIPQNRRAVHKKNK